MTSHIIPDMFLLVLELCLSDASPVSSPTRMEPLELQRQLFSVGDLFQTDMHALIRNGNGEPRFRLAYLPCRNRCEIPRLILEEAGCCYDMEVIGFQTWKASVKPLAPYGKLPCLVNYDGLNHDLGQEQTITRFLAQRVGLAGRTVLEQAKVDELYSFLFATLRNNGLSHDGEHYSVAALKELASQPAEQSAQEERLRYDAMFRQNSHTRAERGLAALRVFEEHLEASNTGYLVGWCTYADLALLHVLWELAEPDNVPDFATRFDLPQLGAFLERMEERRSREHTFGRLVACLDTAGTPAVQRTPTVEGAIRLCRTRCSRERPSLVLAVLVSASSRPQTTVRTPRRQDLFRNSDSIVCFLREDF